MDNVINSEERKTQIYDYVFDEDHYLHFGIVTSDGYGLDGLFRVYDPQNGPSMTMVTIDYGYFHPEIAAEWNAIENDLRNISIARYQELVAHLSAEERYAEAMALAGFEKIELPEDDMATVWFQNPLTGEKILSDGWEGILDQLEEMDLQDTFMAELIDRLIHPENQFSYYALDVEDAEKKGSSAYFYGNLTDTLEQYHQFRGNKLIGIHASEENGAETHLVVSTFDPIKQQHIIMDDLEINFYAVDFIGQDRETIMNMYEELADRLYHKNAYELTYKALIDIKDGAVADIGESYYCRVANNHRPQDYLEITMKNLSELEIGIEIKVVHANEVIHENGYAMDLMDAKEKDKVPDFNWNQEFESVLGIRSLVDRMDTDYSQGFTIYSNDLSKGVPLQDHIVNLALEGYDAYPSEPVSLTGDLQNILNGMTEDEKEALVQGVEVARDYNQEIPEADQRLYEAIIAERNSHREHEAEIKMEGKDILDLEFAGTSDLRRITMLEESVTLFMNRDFTRKQIYEIREGFVNGLTKEQVKLYAVSEFVSFQMAEIRKGLEAGLTEDQVKIYANPDFNSIQMSIIRKGIENGLTEEQTRLYATPTFDCVQMLEIQMGIEDRLTEAQIRLYATPEFKAKEMEEIRRGIENGLPEEKVRLYAKPEFSASKMEEIRKEMEKDLTKQKSDQKFYEQITDKNQEHDITRQQMIGRGR